METTVGIAVLTWGGLLVVLGPQWARNDFRTDLAHLDLLRSYPVEPDALVRAEAGAAALVVSLAQFVLLAIGTVALSASPEIELTGAERTVAAISALVLLPALNFMGLMIMNGAALLFPAWVRTAHSRAGGIDTLGQTVLTAAAYLLALTVALLVPVAVGRGAGAAGVAAVALAGVGVRADRSLDGRHRGRLRHQPRGWNWRWTERRYSRSTWV